MGILTRLDLMLLVGVSIGSYVSLATPLEDGNSSSNGQLAGTAAAENKPTTLQTPAASSAAHKKPAESQESSSIASERLMRDLAKVRKSAIYKKRHYRVNLVEDNLYEWRINISSALLDENCKLFKDLKKMQESGNGDSIELRFSFNENYPFEPPFVRVSRPLVQGMHVLRGGSICLQLLSPKHWSSSYTVETVVIQIAQILGEDAAIVSLDAEETADRLNLEEARKGHEFAMQIHDDEWSAT